MGVPWQRELAIGAFAHNGECIVNRDVVQTFQITKDVINHELQSARRELERRDHVYRSGDPAPDPRDRTVILVDDGLVTGATMRAAIAAVRQSRPARVVSAVPVGLTDSLRTVATEADDVICPVTPTDFQCLGQLYDDYVPVSDHEVCERMQRTWPRQAARSLS
jgi:predicted phosphoribosyltransferase